MEQLWAPWRMAYLAGEPEPGCLFCRLFEAGPEDDLKNLVVWKEPQALVVLNKFPYNSGHLMVAPARHTGDLTSLEADEMAALMAAVQKGVALLQRVMSPEGFNAGINLG